MKNPSQNLRDWSKLICHLHQGASRVLKSHALWIKEKIFQKSNLIRLLKLKLDTEISWEERLYFSEHHLSHAASAYFPSPFSNAAILTMDGVGEWTTNSVAIGEKNKIEIIKEIRFPHSLGLLYSAFTSYAGFKVNSGEYKLMGLAPYGEPKYHNKIKNCLIDVKPDGSYFLDMSYFNYCIGLSMTNEKFNRIFGEKPRKPETELKQFHMDIAASIQSLTEEIVIKQARDISKKTKSKNLCMAGGVALNCVANGKLKSEGIFENIWIQPAAGDAGAALSRSGF